MKRAGHRLICFLLSFMLMISPAGNLSLEGGISSAFRTYAAELSADSEGGNSVSDSGSGSEADGSGSEAGSSGSESSGSGSESSGSGSGTGSGEGTEGGSSSETGDGTESGSGSETGDETESGSGSQGGAGDVTGGEDHQGSGSSTESGDGTESGNGSETGNGSVGGSGQSGEETGGSGEETGGSDEETGSGNSSQGSGEGTTGSGEGTESGKQTGDQSSEVTEDQTGSKTEDPSAENGQQTEKETAAETAEKTTEETTEETGQDTGEETSGIGSGGAGAGGSGAGAVVQTEKPAEKPAAAAAETISRPKQVVICEAETEEIVPYDEERKPEEQTDRAERFWKEVFRRRPRTSWEKTQEEERLAAEQEEETRKTEGTGTPEGTGIPEKVSTQEEVLADGQQTGAEPFAIRISGEIPEEVTAKAFFIPYEEKAFYSETALLAVDVELYDEEGRPYTPKSPVTVTLGGELIADALDRDLSLLVYDYEVRKENDGKDTVDALLYRDLLKEDETVSGQGTVINDLVVTEAEDAGQQKEEQENEPFIFNEDEEGLLLNEENEAEFSTSKMPLNLIISGQLPTREIQAVSEDGMLEAEITGAFSEGTTAELVSMDPEHLYSRTGGAGLLGAEIILSDPVDGVYLPDHPVEIILTGDAVEEALDREEDPEVWRIRRSGSAEKVDHVGIQDNAVSITEKGILNFIVAEAGADLSSAASLKGLQIGNMLASGLLGAPASAYADSDKYVTVKKTLEDLSAIHKKADFVYSVTLLDDNTSEPVSDWPLIKSVGEQEGLITDSSGTAEFTLSLLHGGEESVELNIPEGCSLEIDEQLSEEQEQNYTSSVKVNGTAVNEPVQLSEGTAEFHSTRNFCLITVQKTVETPLAFGEFGFKTTLTDNAEPIEDYPILENGTEVTDPEGICRFTLTERKQSVILNIPMGADVTVEEDESEDFDTQINYGGHITHERSHAFTNVTETGGIGITFINRENPNLKITKDDVENTFRTFDDAFSWMRDNGLTVAVIEMLRDYAISSEDEQLHVPNNYHITLTTAETSGCEYPYLGDPTEGRAVISRDVNGTSMSGLLISNYGILDLQKITLDGAGVQATAALVENQGTLTAMEDTIFRNAVSTGQGGAVNSAGGTVRFDGTLFEKNNAASGGAIYASEGSVTLNGAAFTRNSASSSGGAIYTAQATVVLGDSTTFQSNTAGDLGGAVFTDKGTVSLSGGSMSGNKAKNGAAIYVRNGVGNLSGGTISGNTASEGGAVGVGSTSARLYFSGSVKVTGNYLGEEDSAPLCNVCLNVDSDSVINAADFDTGAAVGIYVAGDFTSELFINRGQAGSRFGTYTSDANIGAITNDRVAGLRARTEATTRKILWSKALQVEIRYHASYQNEFPGKKNGSWNGTSKHLDGDVDLSAGTYKLSAIADNYFDKAGSSTAAYGCAFAETGEREIPFTSQLTELRWNNADADWDLVCRNGDTVRSNKIVIYFSEPAYVTIENNTMLDEERKGLDLTRTSLSVLNKDVLTYGYGYVIVRNNILCDPRPITAEDLDLKAGESVRLMFPGGCSRAYEMQGRFLGETIDQYEKVDVFRTGQADTVISRDEMGNGFTLSGNLLQKSRENLTILFGSSRPVCKIKDKNGTEHPFTSLRAALLFAETNEGGLLEEKGQAVIELLIDYLLPESDAAVLAKGDRITLTTAARQGGVYNYTGNNTEGTPRATISRDPGNKLPFISTENGTIADGTSLIIENLILDGRNLAGSADGGALQSTNCSVTVRNTEIKNFVAGNGGGIYVNFTAAGGQLRISDSRFENCISKTTKNRQGGGAVWTSAEDVSIADTAFASCSASDQGGAVFHRIDQDYAWRKTSKTVITGCSFRDCFAKAAGGIEMDSYDVTVSGCVFTNCQATDRNGGGLNIYIHDNANSSEQTITRVSDCEFRSCSAVKQNGGGLRSSSLRTEVTGCTFRDSTALYGGGLAITNTNSPQAVVTGCTMTGCSALQRGGGLYCTTPKTDLVTDSCVISGNSAGTQGGGIYSTASVNLRNTEVSGNRLTNTDPLNAGGVYLPNGKTLILGDASHAADTSYRDHSSVKDNRTSGGAASNIRLSETNSVNSVNAVSVLCGLDGELFVVNAKNKGTQFGSSAIANPAGFSELFHIFRSDDGKLYGAVDRTDSTGEKLVWQGQWICKITDGDGNLLYLDQNHLYPALFDQLDTGTTAAGNTTAFGMLKYTKNSLKLYNNSGKLYSGDTFYVKMLVESCEVNKYVTTNNSNASWEKIILTTASRDEKDGFSYEGRPGTSCTIYRGASLGASSLITAKVDITLEHITLDGNIGSGITTNVTGGLLMMKDADRTLTIGEGATLQNSTTTKDGGAVYVNKGTLVLDGGMIRNCKGVNGGGIALVNGSASVVSGTITNCSADSGGGVYVAGGRTLTVKGGSITGNSAAKTGGGIAVASNTARLVFSGMPQVTGNQKNGIPCNTELNFDSNDVIRSAGLLNGALIGIYVPDGANFYSKHGDKGHPFGRYTGYKDDAIHSFLNDRNGLKGGLVNNGAKETVYWVRMLSLEVLKEVDSDDGVELDEELFPFAVTLTPKEGGAPITGTYGGMTFKNNIAEFKLGHGEKITAEDLPEGYHYTVEELIEYIDDDGEDNIEGRYITTPATRKKTGRIGENLESSIPAARYISSVTFINTRVICKVVDNEGRLLYRSRGGTRQPAVYAKLAEAFKQVSAGTLQTKSGSSYSGAYEIQMLVPEYSMNDSAVLDAAREVTLTTAPSDEMELPDPDDHFYYPDMAGEPAVVSRSLLAADGPMISLYGREGRRPSLILKNITLDGSSEEAGEYAVSGNSGILYATNHSRLELQNGAVLRNSSIKGNGGAVYAAQNVSLRMETGASVLNCSAGGSGGAVYAASGSRFIMTGGSISGCISKKDGAGVFLAEGSRMELSGSPDFGGTEMQEGNHQDRTLTDQKNGGEDYIRPRQDIFIAGYDEKDAESLVLTGDLVQEGESSGGSPLAAGSIWVWAENSLHHKSGMQFGMIDPALSGEISEDTLKVFRNAADDAASENLTESWLYGTAGGDEIKQLFWNGLSEAESLEYARRVILRKVSREFVPLEGAEFTLYREKSTEPVTIGTEDGSVTLEDLVSDAGGVFYVGMLPYGTYYLHETVGPAGYTGNKWFTLTVTEEGIEYSEARDTREDPSAS